MDIQFVSDSLSMFIMFIILSPCLSTILILWQFVCQRGESICYEGSLSTMPHAVQAQMHHVVGRLESCGKHIYGMAESPKRSSLIRVLSDAWDTSLWRLWIILTSIPQDTWDTSGTLWDLQRSVKSQLTRRWSPQGEARNPDLTTCARCARCARCRSLNSTFDAKKMLRWIQSIIMIFMYALYTYIYTHCIVNTCYMYVIISICIYFTYIYMDYHLYDLYILCVCVTSMLGSINCSAQPLRPSA